MTIRETITNVVARQGSKVFLVDAISGREISYRQFHRQACALAKQLEGRGIRKGDRIAIMVPNCCELAILYFACIYLGAVIVPINSALSRSDVQFILESCRPKMVVANLSSADAVTSLHPNVLRLTAEHDGVDTVAADEIRIESQPDMTNFVPLETADSEDLVVVMYTSGTSARPKGLAHKLGSMLRNATAFAGAQKIDQDSRFYLTLSMSYMGGLYNLLLLPFLCGASVVLDHVFDARSSLHFWDKARKYEINALWLAPTVLSILLRMDRGSTGEELCRTSIRHAFVGFAPLSLRVKDDFESRYGVRLIENYGLSETLFVTARSQNHSTGPGYVGSPLPGIKLCIVDDSQALLASGVDGEVQVLTPDLMAGYLNADGAVSEIDSAGWFSTGDIGHLDDQGSLFITGRKKDLIIRGGVNISPAAIEEALLQVEGIVEAAVVSIPHELYGEDIMGVLKLEPGVELESILDSVMAHAKYKLAQHQQPARYMAIDELPRTANGKVQKALLRELVAQKLQVSSTSTVRPSALVSAGVSR